VNGGNRLTRRSSGDGRSNGDLLLSDRSGDPHPVFPPVWVRSLWVWRPLQRFVLEAEAVVRLFGVPRDHLQMQAQAKKPRTVGLPNLSAHDMHMLRRAHALACSGTRLRWAIR